MAGGVVGSHEYARIRLAFGASVYFGVLPAGTLDRLARLARIERFPHGGPVHHAGERTSMLWLVLAGALRINAPTEDGGVTVAMIGEGSFYSAGVFVEGALASTDCHAERGTVTAVVHGADVRALEASDAAMRALMPKLIFARYQAVTSLYADVLSLPLPQRLARRLVAQAMTHGRRDAGADVELRISQTDLAEMLGASRSKVNVELRKLEQEGIVRTGYRRVYVTDFAKLCALAGPKVRAL